MPFLVAPRERRIEGVVASRLAARLCPYGEALQRIPLADDYDAWVTPLARASSERIGARWSTGTARFEVTWSPSGVRLASDPLGTCPLWYAPVTGGFVVSPEAKAIAVVAPVELRSSSELFRSGRRPPEWSPFAATARVPPGAVLELAAGAARTRGEPMRFAVDADADRGDREWVRELGERLAAAYVAAPVATGVLVSGGIDSSIAASLAARSLGREEQPLRTYSLGSAYGDEYAAARALAEHVASEHREVEVDADTLRAELDRAIFENEVFDGLSAEVLAQLGVLYRSASATCRRVATGYGSDLLFDGMLRHREYMAAVGLETTAELIERTRWTGELAPFIHWSLGVAAEHVFWAPEVIETALAVPRDLCHVDGIEKHVLRAAAVSAGLLPEELAFAAKRPLSEGTGGHHLLADALDLEDAYAYRAKSEYCVAQLRRLLAS